jgi:crossover junction endodeoxyribonuclease RuvC
VKVLGIDPGTAVLGYGVVERGSGPHAKLIQCGTLTTRPSEPLAARLRVIYDGVSTLLATHAPDAMAVESVFYGRNVRTTVVLSHARGVILLAGMQVGVSIAEYSPAMVKKMIVGRGAALKTQVGYMVAQMLRLKTPPRPDDAADGVALALTHLLIAGRQAAFFRQVTGAS